MKKVLIPYFQINGRASFPDDFSHFTGGEKITFAGEDYWLFDYSGAENLETGAHSYISMMEVLKSFQGGTLIFASMENVTDPGNPQAIEIQAPGNLVSFTAGSRTRQRVEARNSSGDLIPLNQTFSLPIVGKYAGDPTRPVDITFSDGVAEWEMDWPNPGMWHVTQEHVNSDIQNPDEHFQFAGCSIKVRENI